MSGRRLIIPPASRRRAKAAMATASPLAFRHVLANILWDNVMLNLSSLLYTVVFVIPILVFLYIYIRKRREIGSLDVILIAGIIWVCGFAVTVGFGGIIFTIIAYARKVIDHFV
jgi:hypothetical protein